MRQRLILTLILSILLSIQITAQDTHYEADWNSLDKRPLPTWFEDAKFGIFIHWGPYSVPAWSPKGTYSEWYQYWLQSESIFGNGDFTGQEIPEFQKNTYGPDSDYYDFGPMFKADLFDAKEWSSLFERSGSKYIVITSKHHDGFCLWPSKEANDRGFAWNSFDTGAKRDLLGELTNEVKKTEVKMGMYYSLYEWYHPWWINDRERFVDELFHPQVKDLVQRYEPDVLWADGEWEMTSDKWKTEELIAWLYNDSKVKDNIIINDRWGQETRHKHGGYYTTEYESDANFNKPWEECRGMGFSFGYNRNEDIEDYNSAKALVLMLCDLVAQGGNLLLDIGPDARGRIPVIMQERLLEIGQWLDINGEAIYGTRRWKNPVQWSEGKRDCKGKDEHYVGGDYILRQTINPPGEDCAVKEIFFTHKNNTLYAITPKWPGEKLIIKNVQASDNSKIYFLDSNTELQWEQKGSDIVVSLPEYNPNNIKSDIAYAFSISQIKNYAQKPEIHVKYNGFSENPLIRLSGPSNSKVYYTIDGTDPTNKSKVYNKDIKIRKSCTLKCFASMEGKQNSEIISQRIIVYDQVKDIQLKTTNSERYNANGVVSLMDNIIGTPETQGEDFLGFEGSDAEIVIDFGKKREFSSVSIGYLQNQGGWIFAPDKVIVSLSDNGKNFEEIVSRTVQNSRDEGSKERKESILNFENRSGRFLHIKIQNIGKLPKWHKGAGGDAWLFIDEISVE
jgi:alpha-L-fucosidase